MRPLMLLSRTRSMTQHFLLLWKPSTSRWPIAPFAKRYIQYIDTTWYNQALLYLIWPVLGVSSKPFVPSSLCGCPYALVCFDDTPSFSPGPCFLARWCAWLSWETWMQFCPTFRPSPWKQHFFRLLSGAKLSILQLSKPQQPQLCRSPKNSDC